MYRCIVINNHFDATHRLGIFSYQALTEDTKWLPIRPTRSLVQLVSWYVPKNHPVRYSSAPIAPVRPSYVRVTKAGREICVMYKFSRSRLITTIARLPRYLERIILLPSILSLVVVGANEPAHEKYICICSCATFFELNG